MVEFAAFIGLLGQIFGEEVVDHWNESKWLLI